MEVKHLADRPEAIPTLAAWVYDQWGHWMSRPSFATEASARRWFKR